MHLVLNRFKERLCLIGLWVIVNTGRKDIEHLPPKHLLAAPYIANAGQKFFEVATAPGFLQDVVVHNEPFARIFVQRTGGPPPEAGANVASHAIANSNNGVQIIMFYIVVFPIGGSCSEIPNN